MQDETDTLLEFPCDFTFKVIGEKSDNLEADVFALFLRHFPKMGEGAIRLKPSKNEKYLSLSVIVYAESKAQLDAVYKELTDHPLVLFVL